MIPNSKISTTFRCDEMLSDSDCSEDYENDFFYQGFLGEDESTTLHLKEGVELLQDNIY